MSSAIIVVPCYNEAERLRADAFVDFLAHADGVQLLFVNDGSTDGTQGVLEKLVAVDPSRLSVLALPVNRGKAEAVRQGCLRAFAEGPDYVGFWDADLATPLEAILDFQDLLDSRPDLLMVFGARVQLLGRSIERNPLRHYLGRVFATAASLALNLSIYDTQCGAKLFRTSSRTASLFARPFSTRWIFDVELLARFIYETRLNQASPVEKLIYEFPVHRWHDVAGSKVKGRDFVKAAFELATIWYTYLRPGARVPGSKIETPAVVPAPMFSRRRTASSLSTAAAHDEAA
jgi:dolichyl-phosphate beta-glucosyltransferase